MILKTEFIFLWNELIETMLLHIWKEQISEGSVRQEISVTDRLEEY